MFAAALLAHLASFAILATGSLGGLLVHQALVAQLAVPGATVAPLLRLGARLGLVARVGSVLMLASGLTLMAARGWGDWGHPWLMAKLALWLFLSANGMVVGGPAGAAAAQALATGNAALAMPALGRLGRFHLVQGIGTLAMVALGVFGPR
ncbi:MAG: hypothetical protein HY275_12770 [Gemmatimonadetes bacterium]|nr:hypothetical protein [Gemmatimonadota bacterium]